MIKLFADLACKQQRTSTRLHNFVKMCSAKTNELTTSYKALAQTPALLGGRINGDQSITSVWSQRNLEKGKSSKFLKTHIVNQDGKITNLFPSDVSDEVISTISTSETLRAVVREVENGKGTNQYLEVWQVGRLIQSVDLTALDLHGKVYADGEFASFEFSPNEKKLLYVAESKTAKRSGINQRAKVDSKEEGWKSLEYEQDWGEQLVGKVSPVLVIYDLEADTFNIPGMVPKEISLAQPIWGVDEKSVFGIAYRTNPRKLGLIYCTNRLSTIFSLDLTVGVYKELPLNGKSVKSPRLSPDGKSLIWLQRDSGSAHYDCMTLVQVDLPLTDAVDVNVIIDVVPKEIKIAKGNSFYGLFASKLPARCWTQDGKIAFTTNQRNTMNSYLLDLGTKELTELEYLEGSQLVLDVCGSKILMNRRNFFKQDELISLDLKDGSVTQLTQTSALKDSEKYMWEYLELEQDNNDAIRDFSAIYLGPKGGADGKVPLIVWPHGGPHSAFANNLFLEGTFFLSQGYALLLINYRGSIGAGADSIKFLLGRVGTADVKDCLLATKTVLRKHRHLNEAKVALIGGSHGGFLVTHLSGQYPDMFRAVVARNPAIDLASMSITSDIPDWCYVESGSDYTQVGEISEAVLLQMRRCSPIVHAHKVKAPTLLQIGSKDLRVPPSQGIDYYQRLKANNVPTKLNLYDDNHPLGSVPNEMDNIISTALWLHEHLPKDD